MSKVPPRWADRLLEWFCRSEFLEDLQGDLHELYAEYYSESESGWGAMHYLWWVIRSFRRDILKNPFQQFITWTMTKNNLKIASRVLWRDKFNSLLNITGLAIGLTCFLLIGFYVKQEMSFDQMHAKKDRIYRVWVKEDYGGGKVFFNSTTPLIFEQVLEKDFPEVERSVRFDLNAYLVGPDPDPQNENVGIISPDFFEVFDFKLLKGNIDQVFADRNSVILSTSYAKKYFGLADPMGQTLEIRIGEDKRNFTVSAIFEDLPNNSSIQFDLAISAENSIQIYGERAMTAWFNVSPETYILLKEDVDIKGVEEKAPSVVMSYLSERVEEGQYKMGFQELTDIHLNPEIPLGLGPVGNPNYVYILGIIGLFVLISASVNYATLAIGQSLKRRKEVGVRKVMGAQKGVLIWQYLSESCLLVFFAMLIAILLAYLCLPIFNELTDANVNIGFSLWHLPLYLGLIFGVGFLAGIYPALILSGLKTIDILSGISNPRRAHYLRKGMLTFQFILTVFLISSTIIMRQQLSFMKNKDLGYQYDATVSIPLYPDPAANSLASFINSAMERGHLFRGEILKYPEVSEVGMGTHVFGTAGWGRMTFTDDQNQYRRFNLLVADPQYLSTFDIKISQGRNFELESSLDKRTGVILNEAAVAYFGMENPIGLKLPSKRFGEHRIIGVTEDFNFSSLHSEVSPLVITQNVSIINQGISDQDYGDTPIPKLVFNYRGENLSQVGNLLKQEWSKIFPGEELNFAFVEDNINAQYFEEQRMNKMMGFATILAIIVASLGLLGMTVLMTNSRIREIGIRKVVGASERSIFTLLAKSFAPQLIVGILLSVPITYWLMKNWLNNFAYRMLLGFEWFLLGGIISLLIAFFVISIHTLKAARINPVDSIRKS